MKIHGYDSRRPSTEIYLPEKVIERRKTRIFIIQPVRNISKSLKEQLENHVEKLEKEGYEVYLPMRDTNQDDNTGYRICGDNCEAIEWADVIYVAWDGKSEGGLFDLGMAFALKKPIKIIEDILPEKSSGKSFQNMIREWAGVI